MKQLLFMIVATGLGILGPLTGRAFWGVVVYYLFAVLRPQYLWEWVLPEFGWSFYVALATIAALFLRIDTGRASGEEGPPPPSPRMGRHTSGSSCSARGWR